MDEISGPFLAALMRSHCWLNKQGAQSLASGPGGLRRSPGLKLMLTSYPSFKLQPPTQFICVMLTPVCHLDGGVKLPGLSAHVSRLVLLLSVGMHQTAGLSGHLVGFISAIQIVRVHEPERLATVCTLLDIALVRRVHYHGHLLSDAAQCRLPLFGSFPEAGAALRGRGHHAVPQDEDLRGPALTAAGLAAAGSRSAGSPRSTPAPR